ncbi:MAG: hypothetical protein AMXMBFR57_19430 [Acidimicrobiia bacterium]
MRLKFVVLAVVAGLCVPMAAAAQQTGNIAGRVVDSSGGALPGVTVEATSPSLPQPRVMVTGANGDYRMVALQPGTYTVSFTLSGMQTVTRTAQVQLSQDTTVNVTMSVQGVTETVTVTATASYVDPTSATLKSGISQEQISALPVGQEYRDILRLLPGVQFTADQVRGPSAGGSGQDNVYLFDGVNVTLPLFGTLSAEPSAHDIAQVTVVKGGARAIDFDRAGGFSVDSVSRSGTNQFMGTLSYQFQTTGMAADLNSGSLSQYEQDQAWITGNVSGPLLPGKATFYGSYYRPEFSRNNRANLYGDLPKFERVRNEFFGKVTLTPVRDLLLNVSYRDSRRNDTSNLFGSASTATTGTGEETEQRITTADGSWIIGRGLATFKYTRFANENLSRPDNISSAVPSDQIGATLNIAALDTQGQVSLPTPLSNNAAFNAFLQPYINQYGYVNANGVRTGGTSFGYASQFNDQDFFRDNIQFGYNITLGSSVSHEIHVGYQWYKDSEELLRYSNGWGNITLTGGRTSTGGTPIFFTARYQRQTAGLPAIVSDYESQSIEFNDMIRWNNWTFNVGVIASNDTLFGQGLREDSSTLSGYVSAPGNRYKMYELPFKKMIQPRLSVVRSFNNSDTVYASFARYNPAASSLPRAASWDRNLVGQFIDAFFDANGRLFATTPVGSSSGKLFVEDMTPRTTDEYLVGASMQLGQGWSGRVYGRYRHSTHFWEDTNNDARVRFNPPAGIPRELYITDLSARLSQIGSGSSYVIAELDGAYTKYYEATFETDYNRGNVSVRGSYTWSHYFGNMDQDNTTVGNDAAIFIGSSNVADSGGRQLWDNKDGDLRGDRRHMVKVYGSYRLPWNGTFGAYFVAQSGHPWEAWDYRVYSAVVGTSTSDTIRYAEPAGSRITNPHAQVDVKYTQRFRLQGRTAFEIEADLFNVLNTQTGYNPQPSVNTSTFGSSRSFYSPRRIQLLGRFSF